jgi:hypothetical protein
LAGKCKKIILLFVWGLYAVCHKSLLGFQRQEQKHKFYVNFWLGRNDENCSYTQVTNYFSKRFSYISCNYHNAADHGEQLHMAPSVFHMRKLACFLKPGKMQ